MKRGIAGIATIILAAALSHAATLYVDPTSPTDGPGTNWPTAFHTIQPAIDAAVSNDTVLVTNGVYDTGGKAAHGLNRIAVEKPVTVRSVNGPGVTVIKGVGPAGAGAIRCVYLNANTARLMLAGFTLTNGHTRTTGVTEDISGGGVWCSYREVVSNCVLTGNSAIYGGGTFYGTIIDCTFSGNSASYGGGASLGALRNCTFSRNSAIDGGGAHYCGLENCTLTANSASEFGGGIYVGFLDNCIVYYNSAPSDPNCYGPTITYSCTTPSPGGTGVIGDEPMFMNWTNGDLRLRYGSPCIDAGTSLASPGLSTDILGTPRPLDGNWDGTNRFDMGAYEYNPQTADSSGDGIPDWWCRQYGLDPNDAALAGKNMSGTGPYTVWQSWLVLTDPTNPASFFEILAVSNFPPLQVFFPSSTGRCYTLYGCTDLVSGSWTALPGQSNLPVGVGTNFLTDTNPPSGPRFYRVGVGLP